MDLRKVKKLLVFSMLLVVSLAVLPVSAAFAGFDLYTPDASSNKLINLYGDGTGGWQLGFYGPNMTWTGDTAASISQYGPSTYFDYNKNNAGAGYGRYLPTTQPPTPGPQKITYSYTKQNSIPTALTGVSSTNGVTYFMINGAQVPLSATNLLTQQSATTDDVVFTGTTSGGLQIKVEYKLIATGASTIKDTVEYTYTVTNPATAAAAVPVGLRVPVDTMFGIGDQHITGNDGAMAVVDNAALYVANNFMPASGLVSQNTVFKSDAIGGLGIPASIQSISSYNNEWVTTAGATKSGPLQNSKIAPISLNNAADPITYPIPDFFEYCQYGSQSNWLAANANEGRISTTTIGDSAFGIQWNQYDLAPGDTRVYQWYYGLGDLTIKQNDGLTYSLDGPLQFASTASGVILPANLTIRAINSQTVKNNVMLGFAFDPTQIQVVDPAATVYDVNDPALGIPPGTYPPNCTKVAVKNVGTLGTGNTGNAASPSITVKGINPLGSPAYDTTVYLYLGYTKAGNANISVLHDLTHTMTVPMVKANMISGTITDQSGNPIYRAQVALVNTTTNTIKYSTLTDQSGNYNFSGSSISPGTYKVFVSYPPDTGADIKYMIDPSQTGNDLYTPGIPAYQYAYSLSMVTGVAVNAANWFANPGVLPQGVPVVKGMITNDALTVLPVNATLPANTTYTNYAFNSVIGVIPTILGSVKGQVVDKETGLGIGNVPVYLVDTATGQLVIGASNTLTTDPSGNFTFAAIPVGAYKVYYKLPQFYAFSDLTADNLVPARLDGGNILAPDPTATSIIGAAAGNQASIPAIGTEADRQITVNPNPIHMQKLYNGEINVSILKDPGSQVYTPALQVTLTDTTTNSTDTATLNSSGQFSFGPASFGGRGIAPANSYTVSYATPNGYYQSTAVGITTDSGTGGSNTGTITSAAITFAAADYNGTNYVKTVGFKIEPDGNIGYAGYVYEYDPVSGAVTTTPIPGAQVQLVDSSNNLYLTTTTGASGYYSFAGINPQSQYKVYVTMPATYLNHPDANYQAASNSGNTVALDSANTKNLLGNTGLAPSANKARDGATYTENSNGMFYNAYGVRITGSVSGTVFADTNNNGVLDLLKPRVEGATVYLLTTDAVGRYIIEDSMMTGPDGKYSFSGLLAGQNYQLAYALPDGYRFSNSVTITSGSAQGVYWQPDATSLGNSDAKAGLVNRANNVDGVIAVTSTMRSFTQNMPLAQVAVQISGTVTESGAALANQTVYLVNAQNQIAQTTTTNPSGQYTFNNVTIGTYSVAVTRPALDMFDAAQNAVNVSGAPSGPATANLAYAMKSGLSIVPTTTAVPAPDKYSADVRVAPGISTSEYNLTVDPINLLPSDQLTITGKVVDQNTSGVANVKVTLYDPATGNKIATVVTDGTGAYTFNNATLTVTGTNLAIAPNAVYGLYYDLSDLSSDYSWNSPATYQAAADNGSGQIVAQSGAVNGRMTDQANQVTVRATVNQATEVKLNNTPGGPVSSTLNGTVFLDNVNNNGALDQGETGLAGVTVYLVKAGDKTVVQTFVTNAQGNYTFAIQAAAAGQYLVYAGPPAGYVYDSHSGGMAAGLNITTNPNTLDTTGSAGQYWANQGAIAAGGSETINIPVVRDPNSSISGQVKTPGGAGLNGLVSPDVKAYLVDPNTYQVVETASLDNNGRYSFATLPGSYNIFISYGSGYQKAAGNLNTGLNVEMRLNAAGTALSATTPVNANGLAKMSAVTLANPRAADIYLERKANPGSVNITVNYLNQDGTPLAGVTSDTIPATAFGSQTVTAKYIAGYKLLSADVNGIAAALANRAVTVNPVRTVGDTVNLYYGQVGYITVKHQVSGTGQLLLTETIPGIVNTPGEGISRSFAGYQLVLIGSETIEPVSRPATFAPGGSQTAASTIVFEYTVVPDNVDVIRGNVVVKHVDQNNHNNILAVEQYQGTVGDSVTVSSKVFAGWTLAAGQMQTQSATLTSPTVNEVVFEYVAANPNGGDDAIIDTRDQNGYAQISDLVGSSAGPLLGQRLEVYPMAAGQTSLAGVQLSANNYTGYTAKAPTSQTVTITVRATLPVEFYYGVNVTIQYQDENGQPVDTGNGTGVLNNQNPGDPIDYTQITAPDGYVVDQTATEQLNGGPLTVPSDPSQPVIIVVRPISPATVDVTINYVDENGQPVITGNGTGTLTDQTPGDPIDYGQITPPDGYVVDQAATEQLNGGPLVVPSDPSQPVTIVVRSTGPNTVDVTINYVDESGQPVNAGSGTSTLTGQTPGDPIDYSQITPPVGYAVDQAATEQRNGGPLVVPNAPGQSVTIVLTHTPELGYIKVIHRVAGSGDLLLEENIPGLVGQQGTASARSFAGYQLAVPYATTQTAVFAPAPGAELIFEYNAVNDPNPNALTGNAVVKHLDAHNLNNVLAVEQYQGHDAEMVTATSKQFAGWTLAAGQLQTQTITLRNGVPVPVYTFLYDAVGNGNDTIIDTYNSNAYVEQIGRDAETGAVLGQELVVYPMNPSETEREVTIIPNTYPGYLPQDPIDVTIHPGETKTLDIAYQPDRPTGNTVVLTIRYWDDNGKLVGTQTIGNLTPGTELNLADLTPPTGFVLSANPDWPITVPSDPRSYDVNVTWAGKGINKVFVLHFVDPNAKPVAGVHPGLYSTWNDTVVDNVYGLADYPYDAIFADVADGQLVDYNKDIPSGYRAYNPVTGTINVGVFDANYVAQETVVICKEKVTITVTFKDEKGNPVGAPQTLTLTPGAVYLYSELLGLKLPANYGLRYPTNSYTVPYDDGALSLDVVYSGTTGGPTGGGGGGGNNGYNLVYSAGNGVDKDVTVNVSSGASVTAKDGGSIFTVPDGKEFAGWATTSGGDVVYKSGDTIKMTQNMTLYAVWKEKEPLVILNKSDHFAYILGYPNGTVLPARDISRAEVATIFFRLLTDDSRKSLWQTSSNYSDVTTGKWFNNAVSTLSNAAIVKGYPNGAFRPDASITRAEFAAMASRFATETPTGSASFSDINGHWAANEIVRAAELGWIGGYPDGTFRPNQNITRAEAMAIVNRVLNRHVNSVDDLLTDMHKWTDNSNVGAWYYYDVQESTNSHDYTRNEDGVNEHWTAMLSDPDWKALERPDYQP